MAQQGRLLQHAPGGASLVLDPIEPREHRLNRFAIGTREQPTFPPIAVTPPALDLDAVSDPAFVLARDGRIADLNGRAEQLVGVAREELIGLRIDRVVVAPSEHLLGALVDHDGAVRLFGADEQLIVQHRDGRGIPVELLACPHERGAVLALVRTLATTSGVGEEEVAEIVHDLKNPLSTIALETYLLEMRFSETVDEEARRTFARIRHNLEFVDRMVHDLLDLASLDAGCLQLQRKPTELRALLEDVIERSVATRDRSRVFLEAVSSIVLEIDDLRIQRVVANLLHNALRYSPATAGTVIRLEERDGAVLVSVVDAGPGVPPSELPGLFEKFRRASTGSGLSGSGLGLYVSKRIVEAHGGRIGVENLHGAGARFYFELPA